MLPSSLFNIQREYLQLLGKIEEAEGEITPEIDQALQFVEEQMTEAGQNIGLVIKSMEYWIDDVEKEIKRLEGIRARAIKGKELLKNRLSDAMMQFGIERISSPTITLSFRKSEAVKIFSERALPGEYFDAPPIVPNKTRIKEALKAGKDVPGAEIETRKNLQIK